MKMTFPVPEDLLNFELEISPDEGKLCLQTLWQWTFRTNDSEHHGCGEKSHCDLLCTMHLWTWNGMETSVHNPLTCVGNTQTDRLMLDIVHATHGERKRH